MTTAAPVYIVRPGQTVTIFPGTPKAADITVDSVRHAGTSTMLTWGGAYQYIAPSTALVEIHGH